MKKLVLFGVVSLLLTGSALFLTSCEKEEIEPLGLKLNNPDEDLTATSTLGSSTTGSSPFIVSPTAIPFGKTFPQWTIEWWKYVMSFECAINPILDDDGQHALVGQYGPVVYLAGTAGGSATRLITITRDKLVLFPVINVINDYPCPDFKPAPGQSVESFLSQGAKTTIDQAQNLFVTLDGSPIRVTKASRYATRLFQFTGNKDLINCLDPCITGFAQSAVSDGYWIMLRNLLPGKHVLHIHGELAGSGFVTDVTYYILVK